MKTLGEDFKKIYHNERIMLILMVINLIASIALLVYGLIKLSPNIPVVKTGYGDIGGYRDGSRVDMIAFPLLAIIFGVFHNLIAVRIFRKRGAGMTKFFLIITTILIIGTFIVLARLSQEG